MKRCAWIIFGWIVLTGGFAWADSFDIPRLEGIVIDGKTEDWRGKGFRVGLLKWGRRELAPAEDLDGEFHMGWTDEGLLLRVRVVDDAFVEVADGERAMWKRDCVGLLLSGMGRGTGKHEILITPGRDPDHPKPRVLVNSRVPGLRSGRVWSRCISRGETATQLGSPISTRTA